jgi:excisionase family DNA binding protein
MSASPIVLERVFTRKEAARQLGVSTSTLKRIIAEGRIGQFKTGKRKTVLSEKHIADYLKSVEQPATLLEAEQD